MNGNWASILMSGALSNTTATASLALTLFWGAVTGGRLLFALIDRWMPERVVFKILPAVICIAFLLVPLIPAGNPLAGLLIAFYQLGYGVAAFGVGPLESMAELPLPHIFAATAVPAIGLAILAALLSRKH